MNAATNSTSVSDSAPGSRPSVSNLFHQSSQGASGDSRFFRFDTIAWYTWVPML
jgi:hypothetical protein